MEIYQNAKSGITTKIKKENLYSEFSGIYKQNVQCEKYKVYEKLNIYFEKYFTVYFELLTETLKES
jgi:hypothetical protein